MSETPKFIEDFMEAVYPGAGHLALGSFNEQKALTDATERIQTLETALAAAQREIERLKEDRYQAEKAVEELADNLANARDEIERIKYERDEWKKECRLIGERKGCELFCRSYAEMKAERDRLREALEDLLSAVRDMAADLKGNVPACKRLSGALTAGDAALAGAGEGKPME